MRLKVSVCRRMEDGRRPFASIIWLHNCSVTDCSQTASFYTYGAENKYLIHCEAKRENINKKLKNTEKTMNEFEIISILLNEN